MDPLTQFQALAGEVDDGRLVLEADAARQLVALTREHIEWLRGNHLKTIRSVEYARAFGDFGSAQALAAKFDAVTQSVIHKPLRRIVAR